MTRHIPRIFVAEKLKSQKIIGTTKIQEQHLIKVMRCKHGDNILLFNGKDGEWNSEILIEKKQVVMKVKEQTRQQNSLNDVELWFAPIKKNAMDNIIEKSTEMGVKAIKPIVSEFTQTRKIDEKRMKTQVIHAAQQCGMLAIPEILDIEKLNEAMENVKGKNILFCDEEAEIGNTLETIKKIRKKPVVVLIGPEGGFAQGERQRILEYENTHRISLGEQVLRADTAAIVALALVQTVVGDKA